MWKDKILEERKKGLSFKQIAKKLGCSKGTVSYHLGKGQREKSLKRAREYNKNQHPYYKKWKAFRELRPIRNPKEAKFVNLRIVFKNKLSTYRSRGIHMKSEAEFTVNDIIEKFGENPKCYLTGKDIDVTKPRSFNFDHKIPVSRGGDNSLDNLGIASKEANQAKLNMTPDEFIQLCKNVLTHNGYKIHKTGR